MLSNSTTIVRDKGDLHYARCMVKVCGKNKMGDLKIPKQSLSYFRSL